MKITFPDGSVREYAAGTTALAIAESISPRLAADVLAATVNGEVRDLLRPINEDSTLVLHKWDDKEAKHTYWHTSAHLLAEALTELYPGTRFGIGPAIENGFYYDVQPPQGTVIKETDLEKIEKKMMELAAKNECLTRKDISKADAMKFFGDKGENYKTELISELADGTIVTGHTSDLLGALSAALVNSLKRLAGIDHSIKLLSPTVLTPIQTLKVEHLGSRNPRLHTDEVLLALSICAVTNPVVALALAQLDKLRDCEIHSSVILSPVDQEVFQKLGAHLTCEPVYQNQRLYHK